MQKLQIENIELVENGNIELAEKRIDWKNSLKMSDN